MKKTISRIWKIFELLILFVLLLFGFLQSPVGKNLLAKELSKRLSQADNLEVTIGRISGFIPLHIQVDSIVVGDRAGDWLALKEVQCRWRGLDALNGMINIEQLVADTLEIYRLPEHEPRTTPSKKWSGFPSLEFLLGNLQIDHLRIGEKVAGVPLEYAVKSGGFQLRQSGKFMGMLEISGDADGWVELSAPPRNSGSYLLKLVAELQHFHKPVLPIPGLAGTVEIRLLSDGAKLNLVASAEDLKLNIAAQATTQPTAWLIDFKQLDLEYRGLVGVELHGIVGFKKIDLTGSLLNFNFEDFPVETGTNLVGRVGGQISVAGTLAKPTVVVGVDLLGLTTTQTMLEELPDLNLHLDFSLRDGRFSGASVTTNATLDRLAAQFDFPCAFSLQPFLFKAELNQLTASLDGELNLRVLNGLPALAGQRVQGLLTADLAFDAQQKKEEQFVGHVSVRDGAYEHYAWGVVVRDIHGTLAAKPEGLVVQEFSASDGAEGRVELTGKVGIWAAERPLDLQLKINHANLVRRDEIEAILSGLIDLKGRLFHPAISGELVVDRADILLDNIAPPEPQLLTNFDIDAPVPEIKSAKKVKLPFALDLMVSMPDQIFLNAAVIDSVWGGKVRIQNKPDGISLSGNIYPKRGFISFIGKKFRLADDGRIEFDGLIPASPSINISAEYSRSDIVAYLTLTGKLSNPHYALTSSPALPEDEVLSQVLFGRDTSSISAYQAYQIVAAARQLAGGMRGPGFMYQIRKALSIDTLEWREPDTPDGKSSVAAGKYVTPELYVEVNSTLENKEGSTSMMAEYEITRHFSVETSTGPQMRPGIGLNWKNDY